MRIEILLDLRAHHGLSLGPAWNLLVDGRQTELPLDSSDEVVERLMALGVGEAEARWHASCLTHTTPYYEFELVPRTTEGLLEHP